MHSLKYDWNIVDCDVKQQKKETKLYLILRIRGQGHEKSFWSYIGEFAVFKVKASKAINMDASIMYSISLTTRLSGQSIYCQFCV